MGKTPDQLRAEIESTRAAITDDLDQIEEKVEPGRVASRLLGKLSEQGADAAGAVKGTASRLAHNAKVNTKRMKESAGTALATGTAIVMGNVEKVAAKPKDDQPPG